MELKNAYPGTHATSNAAFLSAAKAKWTESTDYYLGTTVDQIAAQQMGQDTQFPSLELAMDLMEVAIQIVEMVAGFPTMASSDSRAGRRAIKQKSKGGSSSPVTTRALSILKGRPDLQSAVLAAEQARQAS
jgi:hypothetical protein